MHLLKGVHLGKHNMNIHGDAKVVHARGVASFFIYSIFRAISGGDGVLEPYFVILREKNERVKIFEAKP